MDLGLAGKRAIVCASSKGLGFACALALAQEGVKVTINGRDEAALRDAAARIDAIGKDLVVAVVADVTTEAGRAELVKACPDADILVTNASGPPLGDFRQWTRDDWLAAIDANMLAPIEMMKLTVDGMIARRFGRILNITSHAVKAPFPTLGLSNGARTGLTGFVSGLARQTAPYNVTINNLLPGSFETGRLADSAVQAAKLANTTPAEIMKQWHEVEVTGRFGKPEEFGKCCAFLSSVHAGYINAQNILLDGGTYPGTF